jgi:hypothetical protein
VLRKGPAPNFPFSWLFYDQLKKKREYVTSSSVSFPSEANSSTQALSYAFFLSVSGGIDPSQVFMNKRKEIMDKEFKQRNESLLFT